MLVLMLMSMLMSYASVDFFVLSLVLSCAYAYVTSEDQALDAGQLLRFWLNDMGLCPFMIQIIL